MQGWTADTGEQNAREYRNLQQNYIHKMVTELKSRLASGDQTPSILGNVFKQGLLSDEEVLLASYTGSMFDYHILSLWTKLML